MNHIPAQKNKPKTKPIQTQSKPVLLALRSFSEGGSAAEGAVEKLLSLCPESATIIRKSVIRQFKRGRLRWRLLGTASKRILEHSPVGSGLNLEISYYVNTILFGKDRF